MSKKQKQKLAERFQNFQELIPQTIKSMDDISDEGDLYTTLDPGELRIVLPYDLPKYRKFRRAMGKSWVFLMRLFNEYTGCYSVHFKHKKYNNVKLHIDLELSKDGQSCKLVIDYYRQAEPVYKVECK